MANVTRSATIQARVVPAVKKASERILWRIGLNMSEAVELFLRRLIVDERLPFDVVALDTVYLTVAESAKISASERGAATRQDSKLTKRQKSRRKKN